MLQYRNKTFALMAPTLDIVEEGLLPMLLDFCDTVRIPYGRLRNRKRIDIGYNTCLLLSGQNIRAERTNRFHSLAGIFIDEASAIPVPVLNQMITRLRAVENPKMVLTSNPENSDGEFFLEFYDKAADKGMKIIELSSQDNPGVPESYRQTLRDTLTGAARERYLNGVWGVAEAGLVFKHYIKPEPLGWREPHVHNYWIAVDPADSGSTHALLIGMTDTTHEFWVVGEWRQDWRDTARQWTHEMQCEAINEWVRNSIDMQYLRGGVCDHNPSFIMELRRHLGVPIRHADKKATAREKLAGINITRKWVEMGKIRLSDKAPRLEKEFKVYRFNEKAGYKDEPIKTTGIHGCDALRYFVTARK